MMQRLFAILFSAMLLTVGFSACSGDGCLDNSSSIPLAAFYQGNSAVTVSALTVRGIGAPGDSCILKNESASQVFLPLLASKESCQFEFSIKLDSVTTVSDTITFQYKPVPIFVSNECGAMYNFNISKCTTTNNFIDSVAVLYPVITNVNRTSIKIYFIQ